MTRGEVQAAFGSFEFRRTSAAHSRSSMRVRPATRTLPPRAWRSGRPVRVLRSTQTFVWTDGRYSPGFALTLSAKRMRLRPGVTMKLSRSWTRLGPVPWTMSSRPIARLALVTEPHAAVEHHENGNVAGDETDGTVGDVAGC